MMYDIFAPKRKGIFKGNMFNNDINYCREYYKSVIDKIVNYRIEHEWFWPNKNIMSRYIAQMIDPNNLTDFEYFKIIDSNAEDKARVLQMATPYNKGEWMYNNTFKGSREIFYVDATMGNLQEVPRNWKKYNPLEVIYTDNHTLDFTSPDPLVDNQVTIVYRVKAFQLFMQYKYWKTARYMMGLPTDINKYIGQYVYPKMLYSYLDYTLWNIYNSIAFDKSYKIEFENNMPFSVSDYSTKIKNGLMEYVKRFEDTKSPIDHYLWNVPSLINQNAFETLRMPLSSYTLQSMWLPLICRTEDIYKILTVLGANGITANTDYTSEIKRYIRKVRNSGSMLPYNTPRDIVRHVERNLFKIEYSL